MTDSQIHAFILVKCNQRMMRRASLEADEKKIAYLLTEVFCFLSGVEMYADFYKNDEEEMFGFIPTRKRIQVVIIQN